MSTPTHDPIPENHPQSAATEPLPPVPGPPAAPLSAAPGTPVAQQHPYAAQQPPAQPPVVPQPVASQPVASQPVAPHLQYAAPAGVGGPAVPAEPHAHATGEPRRRLWIPVTSAAAAAALVAAAATLGVTHRLDRDGTTSAADGTSSFSQLGQTTNDVVPVAGSSDSAPNWEAVAAAVKASVVAIETTSSAGSALGSGVVIDTAGHIVTNNHVVEGAQDDKVQVTLSDGRIFTADVVGTDQTTDLAVVKIVDPPSDLVPAALGDSAAVRVGQAVMAVGNPLGLQSTVTTGIVSAVDRPVSTRSDTASEATVTNAIQVDASVNPGNSGGPLFDAEGRVIGINSSIATTSQQSGSIGLGFAIPVNQVKNVAEQLMGSGTAKHAFLGVGLSDGTATADGVTRAGALVKQVSDGSPAAAAGIKVDDVIVGIDGEAVGGSDSLTAFVRAHASGDQVSLTVVRDGKAIDVAVTLASKEDTEGQQGGSSTQQGDQGGQGGGQGGQNGPQGQYPDLRNMTPEQLWQWLQENGAGQG